MTLSEHLRALAKPTRRAVLRQVSEASPRHLAELVRRADLPDEDATRVRIRLHHTDLPLLEKNDYIRYDRETGMITRGSNFARVESLVRELDEYEDEIVE
ncbi:DUF7344 domain-containing protein [Halegenticoccus soli]|uniref:DUF7344 domain-containing protein n=1 Tax=Halegenticoccus soli TaxID=1985678 RepID=UPI00117B598F|nr:hypothetical protein [Halegenticoccus soli]